MRKPTYEAGQTIFLEFMSWHIGDREPSVVPYVVTEVNTRSVYAEAVEGKGKVRFAKNATRGSDTFEGFRVWASEEAHRQHRELQKERKKLIDDITRYVKTAHVRELRKVAEVLEISKT